MSGNGKINQTSHHGKKGEYSSENHSPGLSYSTSWIDESSKTLWLFGGYSQLGMNQLHNLLHGFLSGSYF